MGEGKDFWRDVRLGVTKELIVKGGALALTVGLPLVAASVGPVRGWLLTDSHMPRGGVALLVWLLLIAVCGLARLIYVQRRRNQVAPELVPQAPARFDPESFELTPLRARALVKLLDRIQTLTTLHDLHEAAQRYKYEGRHYIDKHQSKGRLQRDMDEAARAGIVHVTDVPGGPAKYYELTPDGLTWVLTNETALKAMARVDMTEEEQKPSTRYR